SGGLRLDASACSALMRGCSSGGEAQQALQLLQDMRLRGPAPITALNSVLAALPGSAERWEWAVLLLEDAWRESCSGGPSPNTVAYNAAISGCGRHWEAALEMLTDLLRRRLRADEMTCGSAVSACKEAGQWQQALELLFGAASLGLRPNLVIVSAAIAACAKAGAPKPALELLKAMEGMALEPSAVTFNAAASACSAGGLWQRALAVLLAACDGGISATFVSAGTAAAAFEAGGCWEGALGVLRRSVEMSTSGGQQHHQQQQQQQSIAIVLGSCISACGQAGAWERAVHLLHDFCSRRGKPSTTLWNAAIAACAQASRWEMALDLLSGMSESWGRAAEGTGRARSDGSELRPDAFSYNSAVSACEACGQWQWALNLLEEMRQGTLATDAMTYHMVMNACMKGLMWQHCLCLLQTLEQDPLLDPGDFAYGCAVGACLRTLQWEQAVLLVDGLWQRGLSPDRATCNAALTVCQRAGCWVPALSLLERMRHFGPSPDQITFNVAISTCATGAQWQLALCLLDEMRSAAARGNEVVVNEVSFAAAISACARGHRWEQTLQLLSEMRQLGFRPNIIACSAAIGACSASRRAEHVAALLGQTSSCVADFLGDGSAASLSDGPGSSSGSENSALGHINIVVVALETLLEQDGLRLREADCFQRTVYQAVLRRLRSLCTTQLSELSSSSTLVTLPAGQAVLRDPLLERQSSLGGHFVQQSLAALRLGRTTLKPQPGTTDASTWSHRAIAHQAWVPTTRLECRRVLELGGDLGVEPAAKDIAAWIAATGVSGRGRVGGHSEEVTRSARLSLLPAVLVEHDRSPHAERQALLALIHSLPQPDEPRSPCSVRGAADEKRAASYLSSEAVRCVFGIPGSEKAVPTILELPVRGKPIKPREGCATLLGVSLRDMLLQSQHRARKTQSMTLEPLSCRRRSDPCDLGRFLLGSEISGAFVFPIPSLCFALAVGLFTEQGPQDALGDGSLLSCHLVMTVAAARKQQKEVDVVLKKARKRFSLSTSVCFNGRLVEDGIEEFDYIFEQAASACCGNQKEKQLERARLGEELKKAINKLQRLRIQIREWIQQADFKGSLKDKLEEARKRIESDMTRFKEFERDLKTKAFSSNALAKDDVLDLEEEEKMRYQEWLSMTIDTLNTQRDEFEADLEILSNKKALSSSEKDSMSTLREEQDRHSWHIGKLELLLRALDNEALDMSDLALLRDSVDYYLESHSEPGFMMDEGLYDGFDLQEFEEKAMKPQATEEAVSEAGKESAATPVAAGKAEEPALAKAKAKEKAKEKDKKKDKKKDEKTPKTQTPNGAAVGAAVVGGKVVAVSKVLGKDAVQQVSGPEAKVVEAKKVIRSIVDDLAEDEAKVQADQLLGDAEEFICKICQVHVVGCSPKLTNCSHLFCGDCLAQWFAQHPESQTWAQRARSAGPERVVPCPVCKQPLNEKKDLYPVCGATSRSENLLLWRMLSSLKIVCMNSSQLRPKDGRCDW
ncbi:unnamed protein product, partial [Polarella glacialis]